MGELKPATAEDFEDIYSALLRRHDPNIPKGRWRTIFEPAWGGGPDGQVGYVLREDGRVVGFLGLIFSERNIDGVVQKFANITSWIAEEGGGHGAGLIFPLRRLRSHTITNLTSTPEAFRIFRRFGFAVLDTHCWIIPAVLPRTGLRWQVTEETQEITGRLIDPDRTIYRDHAPYVRQLLAERGARYGHMVYSIVKRRGLRVAKVHHLGGEAELNEVAPDVGRFLMAKHGVLALECDDRLVAPDGVRWSNRRELGVPRLYLSDSVRPPHISELYTEMVLLGTN